MERIEFVPIRLIDAETGEEKIVGKQLYREKHFKTIEVQLHEAYLAPLLPQIIKMADTGR